jgi:signal transduction histidine kinase
LSDSWFSEERYVVGQSFTGRVLCRPPDSTFGQPYWSACLADDQGLDVDSHTRYESKLGPLWCAVVVPLNGSHRTFGAVEVINKLDADGRTSSTAFFDWNDIYWLSTASIAISSSISHLRRQDELALLIEISHEITKTLTEQDDATAIYERIATALVGPLTSYKACLIRIPESPETLKVVARAGDGIAWDERSDDLISLKGRRMAGVVFATGQPEIVSRIADREEAFHNIAWIKRNGLQAYACFPLKIKGDIVGTLSLYIGYEYDFDSDEVRFLTSIASLVGSLTDNLHVAGKIRLGSRDLEEERDKNISSARVAGSIAQVAEERHKHKDALYKVRLALADILPTLSGRAARVLDQQIKFLDREFEAAKEDLSGKNYFARLNLNHVVKSVLRYFTLELKLEHIKFDPDYGDLPDIEANEAQIRDIIVNLVSNAVKAIRTAGRDQGIISVCTGLLTADQREYLYVTVKDDGVGIRNEDRDRIYLRGFSRYAGGTGMGLFITKQIVESYQGTLTYESTVGKGTTFTVRLPLKPIAWQGEE